MPKPQRRYLTALTDLVERRKLTKFANRALRREAARLGGDPKTPVTVRGRDHVHAVLGALLAGEVATEEVRTWAGAILERLAPFDHGGKPISTEIGYQHGLYVVLANLGAAEPRIGLDVEGLARLSFLLDCEDPSRGQSWSGADDVKVKALLDLEFPGWEQEYDAALREAATSYFEDPEILPIMIGGRREPRTSRFDSLVPDMASFHLCDQSWAVEPGAINGLTLLSRVDAGTMVLAAHIVHDHGVVGRIVEVEGTDPVPLPVVEAIPTVLAKAIEAGVPL